MSAHVLIVEDEPTISRLLSYNFKTAGYEPQMVEDGKMALEKILTQPFDLIVLDLMLPGMHGLDILKQIRQRNIMTPVIILTALADEQSVIEGLKLGADDFLAKPFGVAEFFARVTAVMRRGNALKIKEEQWQGESRIRYGELILYPERHEVQFHDFHATLRPKEFAILHFLMKRPGVVAKRDDLINMIWGFDVDVGQRTVDVHINALRKKLEEEVPILQIESIRGVGYKVQLMN